MRRGNYPVDVYDKAQELPAGIAAVASMVIGLGVALLGINQASLVGFQGPLSVALGGAPYGADIGFPLALVTTGVVYFILRRIELARFKR
jgi:hypothetical protein